MCGSEPVKSQEVYLDLGEVGERLSKLTRRDIKSLTAWARGLGRWKYGGSHDLLQEAFLRLLDGRRRWPKDVNLVTFLRNEMRSILSHELASTDDVQLEAIADSLPDKSDAPDALLSLAAIYEDLKGDSYALLVLKAVDDGFTEPEIAEATGLTIGQIKAAKLRIRSRARILL
jgi:DNA-directed RNA polymerase specialized sigma24 family protein